MYHFNIGITRSKRSIDAKTEIWNVFKISLNNMPLCHIFRYLYIYWIFMSLNKLAPFDQNDHVKIMLQLPHLFCEIEN